MTTAGVPAAETTVKKVPAGNCSNGTSPEEIGSGTTNCEVPEVGTTALAVACAEVGPHRDRAGLRTAGLGHI